MDFLKEQLIFYYPNSENLEGMYAYAFNNYKSGKIKDALNLITKCIKLCQKILFS